MNLKCAVIENRLEYVDPNSDHLETALNDVENNFKNVNKPREAVSDSYILLQLARLGKERIRNVHCEFRSFNNNDFMKKMRAFMTGRKAAEDDESDEESENEVTLSRTGKSRTFKKEPKRKESYVLTRPVLKKFGSQCMRYFHVPPKPTFLLGALEKDIAITNKRKYTRATKVEPEVAEKQRTKIRELDANAKETETNNTISEVERVFSVLKKVYKKLKQSPICFYTFVVNPESFSRTIENIFYVSFLVKVTKPLLPPRHSSSRSQTPSPFQRMDTPNSTWTRTTCQFWVSQGSWLGFLPPGSFILNECILSEPVPEKDQTANNTENAKGQKKGVNNIQSMIQMTKIEWRVSV